MNASFETIAGTIRVHPDGGYGDPYVASASVVAQGGVATIIGLSNSDDKWTPEHHRAVLDVLREQGFERARWERIKADGTTAFIERQL